MFFGNAYARAMGISYSALISLIVSTVVVNGVAEAVIAAVFCIAVGKAAKRIIRF